MERIPNEVIDRLKSDIALQRLAESQDITLKKYSNDLIGLRIIGDVPQLIKLKPTI